MKKALVLTLCLVMLVQACNPYAFGETLNHTGSTVNAYQYTGQQLDSATGLYDLRSRYYDPSIGNFLSQDTYPYNVGDPTQLNRYNYTANNPVNWIDPLGLQALAEYSMLQQKNEKQAEAESGAYSSKGSSFVDDAGGMCSFSADTEVATKDGEKPISEVQIGDYVLAWNWETNEVSWYPVTAKFEHEDEIIVHLVVDGEEITTTPEHPFYTEEQGWVNAGDLKEGMHIHNADGMYGEVKSVKSEKSTQRMYNLTVDKAHTFFVGDGQWLVHNTNPCWSAKLSKNLDGYRYDNMDAHHLVPSELRERELTLLANEAGWDHDEWYNGILLPDNVDLSRQIGLPAHTNGHPDYRNFIRDQFDYLEYLAFSENWNAEQAKAALQNLAQEGENYIRNLGGGIRLP